MKDLLEKQSRPDKDDEENGEEKKKRPIIKSATDLQRLKLEKLMKNPDKPISIPETPKEKDYMQTVPSFVRNVMGSSAGAGSGEFHVYRHLRRKEYARQKCIQAKSIREQLDEEYQMKLEKNRLEAEAKTAKKRAKRLKKKQRAKKPKIKNASNVEAEKQDTSDDDDNEDEDENSSEKIDQEHKDEHAANCEEKSTEHSETPICDNADEPQPKEEMSLGKKEADPIENNEKHDNLTKQKTENTENNKEKEAESKEESGAKKDSDEEKSQADNAEKVIDEPITESEPVQS